MDHVPAIITSLDLKLGGVVLVFEKRTNVTNLTQCPDVVLCELDLRGIIVVWDTVFQWVSGYEVCSEASVGHLLHV